MPAHKSGNRKDKPAARRSISGRELLTIGLRDTIISSFDEARARPRSTDTELPPDASARFLQELPVLLDEVKHDAQHDAKVMAGRTARSVRPQLASLRTIHDALATIERALDRLRKGPDQPTDRLLAELAVPAITRLGIMIEMETMVLESRRIRRGAPKDLWSSACKRALVRFWVKEGWLAQLTSSRDGAFVRVLSALLAERDKASSRTSRDRETFDDLAELFRFEKLSGEARSREALQQLVNSLAKPST